MKTNFIHQFMALMFVILLILVWPTVSQGDVRTSENQVTGSATNKAIPSILLLLLSDSSPGPSWSSPLLIENGGYSSALAVDLNDLVHVSYAHSASGAYNDWRSLSFKYWNAAGSRDVIEEDTGFYSSLAVDLNNDLHTSYFAIGLGGLGYGTRDGSTGNWDLSSLHDTGGELTDITTDQDNKVHISHFVDSNSLEYITNRSGDWVSTIIDDDTGFTEWGGAEIVTDSGNNVHIVYYNMTEPHSIMYATNKSGSWVTSTIVVKSIDLILNEITWVKTPSLDIDSDNNLHVSYMFQKWDAKNYDLLENSLKYATTKAVSPGSGNCTTGSDWNCTTVESGGVFSSLAVDSHNTVHIVHWDEYSASLKHAKLDTTGSWNFSTVLTETDWRLQLVEISMDTDSSDKAHISYTIVDRSVPITAARIYYIKEN